VVRLAPLPCFRVKGLIFVISIKSFFNKGQSLILNDRPNLQ
jgi:hypothetical protein